MRYIWTTHAIDRLRERFPGVDHEELDIAAMRPLNALEFNVHRIRPSKSMPTFTDECRRMIVGLSLTGIKGEAIVKTVFRNELM